MLKGEGETQPLRTYPPEHLLDMKHYIRRPCIEDLALLSFQQDVSHNKFRPGKQHKQQRLYHDDFFFLNISATERMDQRVRVLFFFSFVFFICLLGVFFGNGRLNSPTFSTITLITTTTYLPV